MNMVPFFDEASSDIPRGYGLEHSHDGGWYPYHINREDSTQITHFKDEQGLDIRCATRSEALAVLQARTLDMSNIEDPAVQARLLAIYETRVQEERQTAAFYDLMAEAQ